MAPTLLWDACLLVNLWKSIFRIADPRYENILKHSFFKDQLDCEYGQLKETACYTLLLPGKNLNLTTLNNDKKFRNKGNNEDGLQVFKQPENSGLSTIEDLTQPGKLKYSYLIALKLVWNYLNSHVYV